MRSLENELYIYSIKSIPVIQNTTSDYILNFINTFTLLYSCFRLHVKQHSIVHTAIKCVILKLIKRIN